MFIHYCQIRFHFIYRKLYAKLSNFSWPSYWVSFIGKAIGAAILLSAIEALSVAVDIVVLIAPLAATCFIHAYCRHLPVSRPKAAIVGHFVAALCGLASNWMGDLLPASGQTIITVKIGMAIFMSAVSMRVLDSEHPPAAATAVFPVVMTLPMDNWMYPPHMAWGATISVLISLIWDHFSCRFRSDGGKCYLSWIELNTKPLILGLSFCAVGFLMMCGKKLNENIYLIGLHAITLGVVIISIRPFHRLYIQPRF